MPQRSNPSKKAQNKFQDALEMLNDAAREKQRDITDAVGNEYRELKQTFQGAASGLNATGRAYFEGVGKRTEEALLRGEEQLKDMADTLEERVKENPIVYLTAGIGAAFVLGYALSQSRRFTASVPAKKETRPPAS